MLRPCHFEPTFQKHAGVVCGGAQLHVTDRERFEPVRAAVAILAACHRLAPNRFDWGRPPYEYEETLMPIDILWGHEGLRSGVDTGASVDAILDGVDEEVADFVGRVEPYALYD